LDTKIDAQLSYTNYQNDSDRLTTNAYFNANTNEMYKNSEAIRYKTNQLQYLVQSRF
jgi:hypothetical protein